ncbi:MAG: hypothetical protein A2651_00035 [Candidatus Yanofskybacteria bacterium RIFCSPHIGHO2_01_FULL_42_12]|uniref:Uncharacterized protein n=1 Tax=Candidatus Yanofskybacteria bacterium RIFCSPLOWO2_01_FULL_42_49 TaxID=1802694 RepID=A0A1F8GEX0_9BACT|nr:MAG: hypothetical protein A2651_00035 [Candidatus Yanofskybacteria bacterium RIFCSPHIGHO2_01_FULL_42_12]OGN22999.1 MAG: hypothetical protein A2918_02605 [Candidatus Yanofskybacteria bacterium RIFCSPLOWO2_01_FULL_42_49]
MSKQRQQVTISADSKTKLADVLFRQNIPQGIILRENPRNITHFHSYGGISKFFDGLAAGTLWGTVCGSCGNAGIWLPPRVHCPDCWQEMSWVKIDTSQATVYTHSTTNYPGAGFKATVPCPLISVEIPGICTKLMSYLSEFGDGEPYIGMPIRPVFSQNPTYTILDLSWVSRD